VDLPFDIRLASRLVIAHTLLGVACAFASTPGGCSVGGRREDAPVALSEREQHILEELERQFTAPPTDAKSASEHSIAATLLLAGLALLGMVAGAIPALAPASVVDGAPLAGLLLTLVCAVPLGRSLSQLAGDARRRLARRR